jgi:hypothetical protein
MKWRYHSLLMRDLSIADAKLNAEGEKGWELVSVCLVDSNTARAFFKMPAEEDATGTAREHDVALVGGTPFDLG